MVANEIEKVLTLLQPYLIVMIVLSVFMILEKLSKIHNLLKDKKESSKPLINYTSPILKEDTTKKETIKVSTIINNKTKCSHIYKEERGNGWVCIECEEVV